MPAALRGQELLNFLSERQGEDRDKLIYEAGYWGKRGDKVSLQRTRFFEALAAANGHELAPGSRSQRESNGKEATYRLRVGPRGLVPVGGAYTSQCKMQPGSYVRVIIEEGAIVLEPEAAETAAAA